jgi:phage tail sheath protein FI
MPEYLAPGVYVEETSFRAKSIEGVGTSTTAFVGLTRKGTSGQTPPLVTSFVDFERIYGGLDDLEVGGTSMTNYLAHSVLGFFNEGGSRLYVSRVANAAKAAASNPVGDPDGPGVAGRLKAVARFGGVLGNGTVTFVFSDGRPTTKKPLSNAPRGTLVRTGGAPAGAASITGTKVGPFTVANDSVMRVDVSGAAADVKFHGEQLSVTADADLDPAAITEANKNIEVTLDGVVNKLVAPVGAAGRDAVVAALNAQLRAGNVTLNGNKLVFRSDRQGKDAQVKITKNDAFGYTADKNVDGTSVPANNVGDLLAVKVAEVNALLQAAGVAATAGADDTGKLTLKTNATGSAITLSVVAPVGGAVSASDAFGLAQLAGGQAPTRGVDGQAAGYFLKQGDGIDYRNEAGVALGLAALPDDGAVAGGMEVLTVTAEFVDDAGTHFVYEDMALGAEHPRYLGTVLAQEPKNLGDKLANPYALIVDPALTAFQLRRAIDPNDVSRTLTLGGGDDGGAPTATAFGAALDELSKLEDISIVGAPGSGAYNGEAQGILGKLIEHVDTRDKSRYRIAVLETPAKQIPDAARDVRSKIDSTRAALYYPWVITANPLAGPGRDDVPREIAIPPTGFICGIYARNDVEQDVSKAPANEVVRSALRFESDINYHQQELLNPLGINCLRFFPGRGYRVWGARTASSDPEWKYVNVRRYFNYLEASIDRGTQWAVFENNGPRLWQNVRETIEDFLYNEWVSNRLLGESVKQAYFVRCDRSTMTQNDLDNGRLICLIGVSVLKPAEFVIFRIGQKTADARS